MIPRRALLAGLAAATLPAGRAARAQDPEWPRAIAIGTASPGGAYHAYGLGLARLLTRELGIAVNIRETSGPAENLRLLAENAVQIAFVTTGAIQEARGTTALALFTMFDTPLHIVVRRDSPVIDLAQLAGRSVAVGPEGGTGADYAPRIFYALGTEIRPVHGSWDALAARFAAGEIDAIAVASGAPFPAISGLEARRAIRFLPFTPSQVTRARLAAPELGATTIPAGTYPSLNRPYVTVGLYNLAVARRDLPASLAFEIVRDVFANQAALIEAHPAAAATVPANFVHNTVLPWHPGAMRYYGSRAVTGTLRGD
ncbi:TAXI family TRAP transporter solute-binding subunit [Roseomonas sp. HJA6]|uniref:TAXI family TRAP transporter solute-binding subunit n=1 Tax=Roseomonas alba TaxID=2846776 RepID=A0ABS7ABP5_9PROT|nr:TAXI family TRAP transporter solute-binding subunit [Neoroseomonas alba]MBW6399716.1 TAXI family TRAP transporter solute-binding subunit [Neoroseomonas alba]